MENIMRVISNAALLVMLLASCASDIVEDDTYVDPGGVVEECGDAPGLDKCRDADGETYKHADDPDYIKTDSTQQLEKSSAEIREESPKQLEKTIQQIEDDEHH
jgi:hypothetical protein